MNRAFFFLCVAFLAAAAPVHAADCVYRPDPSASSALTLKRGVNLTQWWQGSTYNALQPADLEKIHALGFDFIRLPLNPTWLARDNDEEPERLRQLRCDLISILNAGLSVIVDLHDTGEFRQYLIDNPQEALPDIEDLWMWARPAFEGLPEDRILIGLYNEPGLDDDQWWKTQGQLIADLRHSYPQNTFVATGGDHDGPWDLQDQQPYSDRNVIYDFHYYIPLYLTHHGAHWMDADEAGEKEEKVPYPVPRGVAVGNDNSGLQKYLKEGWNRESLAEDIRAISAWQRRHHTRIACLEFGVYRPYVDDRSRNNWLRDMRELLEDAGIPWALWEYRGSFGLVEMPRRLDEDMVAALGLKVPK